MKQIKDGDYNKTFVSDVESFVRNDLPADSPYRQWKNVEILARFFNVFQQCVDYSPNHSILRSVDKVQLLTLYRLTGDWDGFRLELVPKKDAVSPGHDDI